MAKWNSAGQSEGHCDWFWNALVVFAPILVAACIVFWTATSGAMYGLSNSLGMSVGATRITVGVLVILAATVSSSVIWWKRRLARVGRLHKDGRFDEEREEHAAILASMAADSGAVFSALEDATTWLAGRLDLHLKQIGLEDSLTRERQRWFRDMVRRTHERTTRKVDSLAWVRQYSQEVSCRRFAYEFARVSRGLIPVGRMLGARRRRPRVVLQLAVAMIYRLLIEMRHLRRMIIEEKQKSLHGATQGESE